MGGGELERDRGFPTLIRRYKQLLASVVKEYTLIVIRGAEEGQHPDLRNAQYVHAHVIV